MASKNIAALADFWEIFPEGPTTIEHRLISAWRDWNINGSALQKEYYELLNDLTKKRDILVKHKTKLKKLRLTCQKTDLINENHSIDFGNNSRDSSFEFGDNLGFDGVELDLQ